MDKISDLVQRFTPIANDQLIEELDSLVKGLGIPPSYCTLEEYYEIEGNSQNLLLQRLTIHVQNLTFAGYSEESIMSPNDTDWKIRKVLNVINMPPLSHKNFFQRLEETNREVTSKFIERAQANWFIANIIQNPKDGNLFKISSLNKWPAWIFISTNSDKPFSHLDPNRDEVLDKFLSRLYGINATYDQPFPLTAIIVNQNLIRISKNRLSSIDGEECIKLTFETGNHGLYRPENAKPNLRYQLYGSEKEVIGEGQFFLDKPQLDNGFNVEIDKDFRGVGKKIMNVEAGLYLGDTLVDTFSGGYIRDIRVNITVNGNRV